MPSKIDFEPEAGIDFVPEEAEKPSIQFKPEATASAVGQAERVGKNVVSGGARGLADALSGPSFRELLRSGAIGKALGLPDVPGLTSMPSTAPRPTGTADAVRAYAERMRVPARPEAGAIERFATETLPQGGGNLLVNLGLALPARAVPGRGAATLAVLQTSSAMGSGNAWDEAKKAGATDEVAFQHALTGYGLGMTEVVPMAKWLARTGAGGALRRALREGTEEAIQEWVQTTGQNVSAQKLFDPERPWLQGSGEATAAGATLGTVASLLFSIGGRKGRFAEKPRKAPTPDQDLVFEDEGEPPTPPAAVQAGTPTAAPVPEGPAALAEQFRLAADPKSTRAAALVTPGATAPAVPEGLVAMETPHGTVVYNPSKVRPEDVANAAAGQLFDTSILGMSGQPVSAADTAVTTSTPAARNVAAELTAPEGVAAVVAAQQASVPGGLTEVKPAEAVVAERVADLKGGEPRGQEEVQGQAPGQGLTAQQPGLSSEDVVRLSTFLPITPEDDARYMQAVNTGDMETAQRMVNEAAKKAGYTTKVYHGTNKDFTEFRPSRIGNFGPAIYAAFTRKDALSYAKRIGGDRVIEGFARIENPIKGGNANVVAEKFFGQFPANTDAESVRLAKAAGVDAVWADETLNTSYGPNEPQVAIFDPAQIKSADPVTRDASGNVIPLSQRFNPASPDIRYSSFVPGVPDEEATPLASDTPEVRARRAFTPEGTVERAGYTPEMRAQIRNKLYRVQPMAEAWEKAGAYLDKAGLETAQNAVMDSRSELTPSERVALTVRIESAMQTQERAATAAGDEALAQKIAEDTAAFIDLHIDWTSTESGRALVYQKLRLPESPRTRIAQYRRALKGARAQDRTELDGHIKATIAEAAKAPAEAVLDLAEDRQVQAEVSKVVDAAIEASPEVQEAARTLGVRVRERIARVRNWLRKAYGRIFHASFFGPGGRPPGTPVPRAPRAPLAPTASDDVLDAAIKRRMAVLRQGIARVLKMRLTDQATTRDQLADQLAQATGLPPAQVAALAARLKARYDSLLADRRQRIVARAAAMAPRRHQQRKEPWQVLVDKVNEGTLNEQAIWDAMAGKLKLPAYDPAVAGEIARMATAAQDARSALDRQRAVQRLNDYIAAQTGPTIGEYWTAIWYMRMLSNPLTHVVNTLSNAGQSAVAYAAAASRHPTSAAYLGGAYFRGVLEGVPAILEVLRTGRTTGPRLLKAGMSSPLELPSMRPPGPIRTVSEILRQWRVVGRLLTSEDMLFFHGLREMRAAQLALEEARSLGLRGRAMYAEADRILGADPARMAWARTVAANEGRTGVEAERRALELRDEYRGPEMQEDMLDYALRNTFNTPHPYGVLGAMTRGIETALGEYPVGRLQVPFTRILANVGNESLEWVGLWRTLGNMGQAAWHGSGALTVHGRPAKLNDMWERALKQTLAFAAVTGLIYAVRELLKVPSEDRPWDLYGPGPSSPAANRQWREVYGAKPFTLRIGKRIINLNEHPLGAILAVAATYTDAWRFGELENKGTFTRLAVLVRGLGAAIMERSALAQVRDFFATMGGHGRMPSEAQVAQFLFRPLGGIVSSRLASFLDRVGDPTRYDTATMEGALLSQVAFARRNGKPDLNLWGQPIRSYVSDRLAKTWEPTPLDKFLVDNRAWVADPSPAQLTVDEGPPLSADEHYRFVERAGPEKFARLNEALPTMRKMEPQVVREYVARLASGINRRVKAEILAERPR